MSSKFAHSDHSPDAKRHLDTVDSPTLILLSEKIQVQTELLEHSGFLSQAVTDREFRQRVKQERAAFIQRYINSYMIGLQQILDVKRWEVVWALNKNMMFIRPGAYGREKYFFPNIGSIGWD